MFDDGDEEWLRQDTESALVSGENGRGGGVESRKP